MQGILILIQINLGFTLLKVDQVLVSYYFFIICGCLYWRCKNSQYPGARSPPHVTYTAPENQNMMHTTEDAIRSTRGSDLGLKTVRIQDPVGDMGKVVDAWVQYAFTEAVLDQLAAKWRRCQRASREAKEKEICCSIWNWVLTFTLYPRQNIL